MWAVGTVEILLLLVAFAIDTAGLELLFHVVLCWSSAPEDCSEEQEVEVEAGHSGMPN